MIQLTHDSASKNLTRKALLIAMPYGEKGGIRSSGLVSMKECALNLEHSRSPTDGGGKRDHRGFAQ
jgi:hypothetical protein